jgi:hypothetical protein
MLDAFHRPAVQVVRRSRVLYVGLLAAPLLLLAGLAGCGGGDEPAADADRPAPRRTLVFVDRSASTGDYAAAQQLFADSLDRIVRTYLRRPGDRLSAFIVHEKTRSKAYRLDLTNDVSAPERAEFDDEQALQQARFKRETAAFLSEASNRLQAFALEEDRGATFADQTDLWGTLAVASEELPAADERDADAPPPRIYYLSDMFESMQEPERRNFDRAPPASRAEAERWARADANTLQNMMTVRPARLQDVHVRVLLGTLATKDHAQDVKVYWRELFQEIGIPADQIDYN